LVQSARKAEDAARGIAEPRLRGAERDPQMAGGARAEPVAWQHRDSLAVEQPAREIGSERSSASAGSSIWF